MERERNCYLLIRDMHNYFITKVINTGRRRDYTVIAIIDDGISDLYIDRDKIIQDLIITSAGDIHERKSNQPVITDHGTTIARIILRYIPEATFCSLSIFQSLPLCANCAQMYAAFKWCLEHDVPIINASIGTEDMSCRKDMQSIVRKIQKSGKIIIAAESNKGKKCIPAYLEGVIRVRANPTFYGFSYMRKSKLEFEASSRHVLEDGSITQISNSYAAPTVTAAIYKMCQDIH